MSTNKLHSSFKDKNLSFKENNSSFKDKNSGMKQKNSLKNNLQNDSNKKN